METFTCEYPELAESILLQLHPCDCHALTCVCRALRNIALHVAAVECKQCRLHTHVMSAILRIQYEYRYARDGPIAIAANCVARRRMGDIDVYMVMISVHIFETIRVTTWSISYALVNNGANATVCMVIRKMYVLDPYIMQDIVACNYVFNDVIDIFTIIVQSDICRRIFNMLSERDIAALLGTCHILREYAQTQN